jgi:hypothetical protein
MLEETIMKRLRDWFCGGRTLSAKRQNTNRVRPTLEALEDRRTPSAFGAVSSVNYGGNSETFDVHTDGTLWANLNGSQFVQVTGESNVRSVSVGLDSQNLATVFVVHNNGQLTERTAQIPLNGSGMTLANGVKSVVAEGNGQALVIDNQNFLWQFDPNQPGLGLAFNSDGTPEFQGQPGQSLGPNFTLLDANVTQATPLKAQLLTGGSTPTVIALHGDRTLTSDTTQTIDLPGGGSGNNVLQATIAQGITSISSVTPPGDPNAIYLYVTTTNGHVKKVDLFDNTLYTYTDYAPPSGDAFIDVNVGWNSADWVATTRGGQVYRDGQLIGGGASAFAGPGGSSYAVTQNGTLEQWSSQQHETWVWIYQPPVLNRPGHWVKVPFWTNWTTVDSNVSTN